MACKTDVKPTRSKSPRKAAPCFEPFIRRLPGQAAGGIRIGTTPVPPPRAEPSPSDIRKRAYFIYLARGGVNGDANADWIQAERELREEMNASARLGRRF